LIQVLPASFVVVMAGLTLLAAFQDAMTRAFSGGFTWGGDRLCRDAQHIYRGRHPVRVLGAVRRCRRFADGRAA
jgi:hypothetical protein